MQEPMIALIRFDLLLELVAGIMALAISHYSNMAFKLTGQKRLSDLSTGFLVLSTAMIGRVIGAIYFAAVGGSLDMLALVALVYGMLKVLAYLIFLVSTRPSRGAPGKSENLALLMALPILIDPKLDLIAIIILIMVVLQALMNYLSVRTRYALYVLVGFILLLLSHIESAIAQLNFQGYLFSQFLQFLGLTAFLTMLVKAGKEE
ncbi:MAG: hypothetical protein K9W43_07700 [Candidatus Thorarchaeota archaeon]|nr:hypothetical protein [Candidatus Thorarchaeota archaeon]